MHTTTGDAQTQFCLSLCGVPESWCTQAFVLALWASLKGMGFDSKREFTPLPSCSGFPFALRCVISSHSCSTSMQPLLQRLPSCWVTLTLDVGYLLMAAPAKCSLDLRYLCMATPASYAAAAPHAANFRFLEIHYFFPPPTRVPLFIFLIEWRIL